MMAALRSLSRSLRLQIGRGIVRLVNDANGLQELQVELLAGELLNLERIQQYGFTSVPLPGAEAITVAVGGRRGKSVVIGTDDRRYRVKLAAGEVALYTHTGTLIALRKNNEVEIIAATKVISTTPLWEHTGNLVVAGTISAPSISATNSLQVAGIEVFGHKHPPGSPLSGVMQ